MLLTGKRAHIPLPSWVSLLALALLLLAVVVGPLEVRPI